MANNAIKRKRLQFLWKKQKGRCYWCSIKIYINKSGVDTQEDNTATIDHFIPRSQGGDNSYENIVAACASCNQEKAGKMPTTFLGISTESSSAGAL